MTPHRTTFASDLTEVLSGGSVVTDADAMDAYRRDAAPWVEPGAPAAVAFATSTADVVSTLRTASRHNVPVVARGAGSGLSGGAAAIEGCLVLCLERMDSILEIDAADRTATVQPGVINSEISEAAREFGLFYPPDPASKTFSTIGGNIATNAGGLCCVEYGVTRDYVLGLEVVLADGTRIETGRRTTKGRSWPRSHEPAGRIGGNARGRHGGATPPTRRARSGGQHPTIIIDRGAGDSRSAARDAFEDIMAVAIELGGTITGEHGVGVLKNSQLRRELAPEVLEVHRSIKSSLDPQGLLNPGKALGL